MYDEVFGQLSGLSGSESNLSVSDVSDTDKFRIIGLYNDELSDVANLNDSSVHKII